MHTWFQACAISQHVGMHPEQRPCLYSSFTFKLDSLEACDRKKGGRKGGREGKQGRALALKMKRKKLAWFQARAVAENVGLHPEQRPLSILLFHLQA